MTNTPEFELTLDDIRAFNRCHTIRHTLKYYITYVAILYAITLIPSILSKDFSTATIAVNLLMAISFIVIVLTILYARIMMRVIIILLIILFLLTRGDISGFLALAAPLLISLIYAIYSENNLNRAYRLREDMLTLRTISLDENGVNEKTTKSSSSQNWDMISEISQDKNYIYIWIGRTQAHILPKKIFKSQEDMELFYKTAEDYFVTSKNKIG